MKKPFLFLLALILIDTFSFGQNTNGEFSLRVGYSTTNIIFKEAHDTSFYFLFKWNSGKTFSGDGPEFGISKYINKNLFFDVSFSSFYAQTNHFNSGFYRDDYILKGFQIPLTVNYLIRKSSKRFRINIGGGLQYLNGHFQQFGRITDNSGQITSQSTLTDLHFSELQLSLRPGVQFRIVPNLFISFIVNTSISTIGSLGRYSDHPCLSLKYTYTKKK